jgi:site-specific DNA-methyltransferase (adenine-specific)
MNKYDIFVDSKYYKLIDKLEEYESIIKLYISQDHYKIQTNDSRFRNEKIDNSIICYVSKQKGFKKFINKKYITKKYDNWKVITARASYCASSGFGNTFIGKPNKVHCKSYISFNINSEEEARSLLSYMKCKLPNLMLSLRKSSQDISKETCKWIPLPPLDREWNNDKIHEYFKLSKEDIELVQNTKVIGYNN